MRASPVRSFLIFATALAVGAVSTGCATTKFHEREKLSDAAMTLDSDDAITYLRTKMEAAREGALGRYGPVAAGGCGCQ